MIPARARSRGAAEWEAVTLGRLSARRPCRPGSTAASAIAQACVQLEFDGDRLRAVRAVARATKARTAVSCINPERCWFHAAAGVR